VAGIGKQRERAGKNSGDGLAAEIGQVRGDPDRKGSPVVHLGMPVPMVPVALVVVRHGSALEEECEP